jgi:S1-C subfamily serine protease
MTDSKFFTNYVSTAVTINSRYLNSDLQVVNSNFTGFIKKFVDGRAIIITCAHGLLLNDGVKPILQQNSSNIIPVQIQFPLSGTFNGVYKKGSSRKRNVNVSLGMLGMDVIADIAVLFSYLPSEIDSITSINRQNNINLNQNSNVLFGFNFSDRNKSLKWGNSMNFIAGNPVFCIGDAYANGIDMNDGVCSNNDFVYSPDNPAYTNLTDQFLSSLNVEQGTSGGAVLSKEGKILAIVAWRKTTGGNYVGGASQYTLQRSYEKIRKLNPIKNISGFYIGTNFQGSTGKGWVGLTVYQFMNSQTATELALSFPSLDIKVFENAEGILLTQVLSDGSYGVPQIPMNHAYNLNTHQYESILVNDIILEVNGNKINYFSSNQQINSSIYYNKNNKIVYKIYRPSNNQYYNFELTPVPFPNQLEYVATDPSLSLITDRIVQ